MGEVGKEGHKEVGIEEVGKKKVHH